MRRLALLCLLAPLVTGCSLLDPNCSGPTDTILVEFDGMVERNLVQGAVRMQGDVILPNRPAERVVFSGDSTPGVLTMRVGGGVRSVDFSTTGFALSVPSPMAVGDSFVVVSVPFVFTPSFYPGTVTRREAQVALLDDAVKSVFLDGAVRVIQVRPLELEVRIGSGSATTAPYRAWGTVRFGTSEISRQCFRPT